MALNKGDWCGSITGACAGFISQNDGSSILPRTTRRFIVNKNFSLAFDNSNYNVAFTYLNGRKATARLVRELAAAVLDEVASKDATTIEYKKLLRDHEKLKAEYAALKELYIEEIRSLPSFKEKYEK